MDPVSLAGLALAVVGTLDLCLKYGKEVVTICQKQSHIDKEIDDMILTIQGLWIKTELQLHSLKALWDTLPAPLQDHYAAALARLQNKSLTAWKSLESVTSWNGEIPHVERKAESRMSIHKVKVIYLRKHIKHAVKDLEDWQGRFDPSWYLITRIAKPDVDRQLKVNDDAPENPSIRRLARMREAIKELSADDQSGKSIFVDRKLINKEISQIPRSNTFISAYSETGRKILLDQTQYPFDTSMQRVRPYVRDLARLLLNVDPMTFGLLKCEGVIEVHDEKDAIIQFEFIFEIPSQLSSPTTLRHLLMQEFRCPLNQRIQLAKQLARSVMFVHTAGFVHKNIRPETIIIFPDGANIIGPSFLTGFERIRPADAPTDHYGDLNWDRNIYRHPARQGLWPEELFKMQHDIYSLGVCLLEIALWTSFVRQDGNGITPWSELDLTDALADKDHRRGASVIKRHLVALAKDKLPCFIGDKYTDLTVSCLMCLDKGDQNTFGSEAELRDKDGIIVGVRYIEKILLQIEDISI
ncbi:hypothetical protein AWENTII_003040 [Aspergillus wentii]|nr:hypothetical protein MW887_007205 [Aspergillus wentii]